MPKLIIDIDHEFNAGPFLAHDEKSSEVKPLNEKQLKKLLADASDGDFSLCVCFVNPDEGYADFDVDLTKKGLKKGGVFEFTVDEKKGVAKVKVNGELSVALRSGVAPMIQGYGKKADLRLQAFNYKGGYWNGFMAPLEGQKEDDFKNWYQIKNWKVK